MIPALAPTEGEAPLVVSFALGVSGAEGPTSVQVSYGDMLERQVAAAQERKGPGDLSQLIRSRGTWTVDA